ncbi:uncharacterized protein itprid1 isoform X6 [Lates calcarifer]|uniref:Uncharacterized protein itprid1 isoform X6 n=1 Tax=Lates calcarifer TaxID=8187 RepID=A0A4W6D4T0_LATCA|nr:uncharacterized protein itprid1 isoform X6 [Lates calcarifer]XP_050922598.1 uncharacterized protein itprid1 isoform X6 [Lates calcarifer]
MTCLPNKSMCCHVTKLLAAGISLAAQDSVEPGIIWVTSVAQFPFMATDGAVAKRANLVASKLQWGLKDLPESNTGHDQEAQGSSSQNNVRKWLTTTVTEEDAKCEPLTEATELVRRNPSSDDDLALGVEASLYGKQGVRTVQQFLRWSRSSSALSRWNSFSSATSGHSGPLSVMEVLNLWNDDPEEVLLDLGFGCDEPDLSGRIPARFINYQSQARGINLQVFLEAQKNRIDLENPDVSNRFRQLEVLQQVTTAFSSLVGSSSSSALRAAQGKDLPPEAQERRRRMGMLFRRASKKSLSQVHNYKSQDLTTPNATSSPCAASESSQPPPYLGDKKIPLKRFKPGLLETACLSPLAEEQGTGPEPQSQPHMVFFTGQEGPLRSGPLREGHPLTANASAERKKSPGQASESFEMEEIHSFDDSSVTGSYTGGAENLVRGVIRTNSCQSDSSGFLEEPFILSLPQQTSPGPDLIKALSELSGGSTESQSGDRQGSPSSSSPHNTSSHLISSSLISSGVDNSLLSSPCASPEPSLVLNSSPPLCLPKHDLQSSDMETPLNQDQCAPASLSESVFEYDPPRSSSPKPQNETLPQSPTRSRSPTSSPAQASSLLRESEDIKPDNKDRPCPHLSTPPHDSEGTAFSTFSSVPPSPAPSLDCLFSDLIAINSTQPDFSFESPGNTLPERTEVALHENSLSGSGILSPLLPSSPYLPPFGPDFLCPCSFDSAPLIDSLSQSPENNQKDSVFSDSDGIDLSETPTDTLKEKDETPSSLSFQLDKDNPSIPSPLVLDSCKFEEGCSTLPCLALDPSIPACQSALSSQSHDPDDLIGPAAGKISDLTEQSISHEGQSCSHEENTDTTPASAVQDVIHIKTDHLALDIEDTHQRNERGEDERQTDTVQTGDTVVYISDTESSADLLEGSRLTSEEVCNQMEVDPQVPSCSLHDEPSTEIKQEELRKTCQRDINGTKNDSVLHEVPEVDSKMEVGAKKLIKIESLDQVFETSVDGSEGEYGDVDAFFQQLDSEGQVYWAEPIQVSSPAHAGFESDSFEASDGSPGDSVSSMGKATSLCLSSSATMDTDQSSGNPSASLDTPSSLALASFQSPPGTPDLKPSSRSVSVQMSSSLSSHIVHRKDVPYMTDSKRTPLPSVPPLDTSTPFRAVQAWTDVQIQRNALINKFSHGALHANPNELTMSVGASEMTQRPTLIFSSSPSFPLLSNDPGVARNYQTLSVSVDTGLWPDMEEEVDRNGNEDEKFWEGNHAANMACCCSCDHQCTCCTQKSCNKQHTLGNITYSLGDLEEMMLCLQQFCSVLSNMEEQLSEDQASVYSALSEQDREKVRDIEELRRAVKQEAQELEMQLNDLAHHYDDSLKMKMHRLLDEQSLLCSQLRVFLPGAVPTSSSPTPNRTVATQCCLLPWSAPADMQGDHVSSWSAWNVDSPNQSPHGSESICQGLGCSPTKADKLDIVGLLQKLKESLRHSVNTDSLE